MAVKKIMGTITRTPIARPVFVALVSTTGAIYTNGTGAVYYGMKGA